MQPFIFNQLTIIMEYLVAVGGELYLPVRPCSEGENHFSSISIAPPVVAVTARRPVLPYLRRLVSEFQLLNGLDPFDRVNLLYRTADKDDIFLDLENLVAEPRFDMFVRSTGVTRITSILSANPFPKGQAIRFGYNNGEVFYSGGRLSRRQKVMDIFGPIKGLELTHISSPGVEFVLADDSEVVEKYFSKGEEEKRQEIKENLARYMRVEHLTDADLTDYRVLRALTSLEEATEGSIIDAVIDDGYDDCRCEFGSVDDDISNSIQALISEGIINEIKDSEELKIAPEYRPHYIRPNQLPLFQ